MKVDLDRVMVVVQRSDYVGFCEKCGAEQDGVEDDACEYECESCGALAVYGAGEMLLRHVV